MGEYTSEGATSPLDQRVEFRTYIREGHSVAEREAAVVVSGKTVFKGWVSDGVAYAAFRRIVREGWREADRKHVCRRGGKELRTLEVPPWSAPGELVKIAGEEQWGRVELLWSCCGTYDVRVEAFGEQEAGVFTYPLEGLESAWDAYPANLPPRGYPVPQRSGGRKRV